MGGYLGSLKVEYTVFGGYAAGCMTVIRGVDACRRLLGRLGDVVG